MKQKIAIGKILKPHGVKGDFVFLSYSGILTTKTYTHLVYAMGSEWISLKVVSVRSYKPDKKLFLLQLDGLDRNKIDVLKGIEVFIENLPYESLKEGEFFYKDIEDSKVYLKDEFFGTVVGIHNFSGQDLIEVEYIDAEKQKTRQAFLPLVEPFLSSMDIKTKVIIYEDLNGLI